MRFASCCRGEIVPPSPSSGDLLSRTLVDLAFSNGTKFLALLDGLPQGMQRCGSSVILKPLHLCFQLSWGLSSYYLIPCARRCSGSSPGVRQEFMKGSESSVRTCREIAGEDCKTLRRLPRVRSIIELNGLVQL
ncbi:hypothetical protein BHE74_00006029 [Ensete ventricosum]|nr:hypothetical protein BHE74_00006029 [Ensete ventricosum]